MHSFAVSLNKYATWLNIFCEWWENFQNLIIASIISFIKWFIILCDIAGLQTQKQWNPSSFLEKVDRPQNNDRTSDNVRPKSKIARRNGKHTRYSVPWEKFEAKLCRLCFWPTINWRCRSELLNLFKKFFVTNSSTQSRDFHRNTYIEGLYRNITQSHLFLRHHLQTKKKH